MSVAPNQLVAVATLWSARVAVAFPAFASYHDDYSPQDSPWLMKWFI